MEILWNKKQVKNRKHLTNPIEIYNDLGIKYFGEDFKPYPLDSEVYNLPEHEVVFEEKN